MALENYVGPPPHELAKGFIESWKTFREMMEDSLKAPNLPDDVEMRFLVLKAQIVQRSRILATVTEGKWNIHEKVKGLLNTCQSLEYIRQESPIIHDNIRNLWHDSFIQASKSVAVFESEYQEDTA